MLKTTALKANISEIFRSVQGEGKYAGVPQVFVRFFECHMHCAWCDTPDSIGDTSRHYEELGLAQVLGRIKHLAGGCHSVSLTGGEPLLQADFIQQLLPLLKEAGTPAYLETSGVLCQELAKVIAGIDMVAMDLKLPSSTQCRPFWKEHEEFLKIASPKDVFLKAVISNKTHQDDIVRTVDLVARIDPHVLLILQPNTYDLNDGVMSKCLDFQTYCRKYLSDVRILPQMHKFMRIR